MNLVANCPVDSNNSIKEFEIDLTGTCNLKCDRCSRNYVHAQHLKKANIRSLQEITSQLDQFPELKRCMLAGQVSEPTLYPELIGFLQYLKSRHIKVELYTNASKLNLDLFSDIGKVLDKDDRVIFTICGTRQSIHEQYRKGSSLAVILQNAQALRKQNPIDVCQYIRFKHNLSDWQSGRWTFLGFSHYFWCESEGNRLHEKTVESRKSIPVKQVLYDALFSRLRRRSFYSNDEFICDHLASGKVYIDQFGKVYPCYSIAEYDQIELKDFDFDFCTKEACKLCSKYCREMQQKYGLDFVC